MTQNNKYIRFFFGLGFLFRFEGELSQYCNVWTHRWRRVSICICETPLRYYILQMSTICLEDHAFFRCHKTPDISAYDLNVRLLVLFSCSFFNFILTPNGNAPIRLVFILFYLRWFLPGEQKQREKEEEKIAENWPIIIMRFYRCSTLSFGIMCENAKCAMCRKNKTKRENR